MPANGGTKSGRKIAEFLSPVEALRTVFPKAQKVVSERFLLSAEERHEMEKLLRRPLKQEEFRFYLGVNEGGTLDGFAVIQEELGRFKPFTFIVGVEPNGKVRRVAVMVYREARGGEVARRRFLVQYEGKSATEPFSINRDIINVTGATISVNSMNHGVKKVLAAIEIVYGRHPERVDATLKEAPEFREFRTKVATEIEGEKVRSGLSRYREARLVMGSLCEIEVWGAERVQLRQACRRAFDEIERVDRAISDYRDDSDLSEISSNGAHSPVAVSEITAEFLKQALDISKSSDGAFDLTVGPLVDTWGFRSSRKRLPEWKDIESLRPLVDYRKVRLLSDEHFGWRVSLDIEGMRLDPGGIGKGFAVDRAVTVLKAAGIARALVNFSGNIYALGTPPGQVAWTVGVRDPSQPNSVLGSISLKDAAVASSGGYEKNVVVDGVRLAHILSPRTLRPVSGVLGTTVKAPTATLADGWSTAAMVLGAESIEYLNRLHGLEGLIVLNESERGMRRLATHNWRLQEVDPHTTRVHISTRGTQRGLCAQPKRMR